ncbi:MAG: putative glycosyl hydrolase, partial [Solirubrobacterales bacterium]|nr:putative glycosyl hydrolase [Solirubrobacterales bacterium]
NPEWYALLLARGLLGDRPIRTNVAGGDRTLTAAAFVSSSGNVHVVLVDFRPTGAGRRVVRLRLPRPFRGGPILRLSAPGMRAKTGVTLGGRAVGPDGAWHAGTALPRVSASHGTLELSMAAGSAALVTLYPAR